MAVRMLMAGSLVVAVAACGAKLSPLQERAWDAFKDCQQQAPSVYEILPDEPIVDGLLVATFCSGSG